MSNYSKAASISINNLNHYIDDILHLPLNESILILINSKNLDIFLESSNSFKTEYLNILEKKLEEAFILKKDSAHYEIHSTLYQLYNLQICDPLSTEAVNQHQPFLYEIKNKIEIHWLNFLNLDYIFSHKESEDNISNLIIELCNNKNLSEHSLFNFLANEANKRQLFAFFQSDYELNIRFFDLLILTLLNSPQSARMEMIKNLWDESGKGDRKETHVNMFNDLMNNFHINNIETIIPHNTWQKLAGYNLFMLASLNRKYYYLLLGVMAATEIIDPQSYIKVQSACKRNNMSEWLYRYYSEHSEIDIEHAKGWLTYVIEPIAKERDIKYDILLGAFYRLKTCQDYYDSLYQYLKSIK